MHLTYSNHKKVHRFVKNVIIEINHLKNASMKILYLKENKKKKNNFIPICFAFCMFCLNEFSSLYEKR